MKESLRYATVIAVLMVTLGLAVKPVLAEAGNTSEKSSERLIRKTPATSGDDPFSGIYFTTFYNSGLDACTNEKGLPVILLFSRSSCSHCEWVGKIFDPLVGYYVASGLIEAHHYDIDTGDDLLTDKIETKIPPAYLQLKEHGDPKGFVPYFNFGCKYERVGNGYEKTDDVAAESAEMRKVIETLIKVLSKPEGKTENGHPAVSR